MEDNDKHLGDFFRKRLSETPPERARWSLPDSGIRDRLMEQLPASAAQGGATSLRAAAVGKAIVASVLLLALAAVVYLRMEVSSLQKQLREYEEQRNELPAMREDPILLAAESSTSSLQQNLPASEISADADKQSPGRTPNSENSGIPPNRATAEKGTSQPKFRDPGPDGIPEVDQQSAAASAHQADGQLGEQIPFGENHGVLDAQLVNMPRMAQVISVLQPLGGVPELPDVERKPNLPLVESVVMPLRKAKKGLGQFQIGYLYARQQIALPLLRGIERQQIISGPMVPLRLESTLHGATLAWQVNPALRVRGSVAAGVSKQMALARMGISYDPFGERPRLGGGRENNLDLSTRLGKTEDKRMLLFSFEEGMELEKGDFIELRFRDAREASLVTAVAGLDYTLMEIGPFQGLLTGGLQWTQGRLTSVETKVEAFHKGIPIDVKDNAGAQPTRTRSFAQTSATAGFGLNVSLAGPLQAMALMQMTFPFSFSQNFPPGPFAGSKTGTTLNLGLTWSL